MYFVGKFSVASVISLSLAVSLILSQNTNELTHAISIILGAVTGMVLLTISIAAYTKSKGNDRP